MKISIAAALLLAFAVPSLAAAQPAAPKVALRHADLDLSDPGDAREMLHRIRKAAMRVCTLDERGHDAVLRFDACRKAAVARGVADLNAPAVTAAFEARNAQRALAWAR